MNSLLFVRTAELAALLLLSAAPAEETLLQKHLNWLGGEEVLSQVNSVRFDGTLHVSGLEGEITTLFSRGGYAWIAFDLGITNGIECVAPSGSWNLNGNGDITDLDPQRQSAHRRGLDRTLGKHLLRTDDSEITRLDGEAGFGDTWSALRFTYPDGDFVDLFLDENNGACVGMRNVQGTDTLMVAYTDWRDVDGRRFAFAQRQTGKLAAQNLTMVWSTIVVNPELDESLFKRPEK